MTTWATTYSRGGQGPAGLWERLWGHSEDGSTQISQQVLKTVVTPGTISIQSATGPTETRWVTYAENDTVAQTEAHLSLLVDAAQTGNAVTFVQATRQVEWSQRSAADFITAIHLALATGAHLIARELATMGYQMYPEHAELQKITRVLAPPNVRVSERTSGASRRKDFAWLKQHSTQYRGQWVALKDGELVAAAATIAKLKAQVSSPKDVFLARVP